jgi:hypothetical protein
LEIFIASFPAKIAGAYMRQITTAHLTELLGDHEPPCISLYQPTHRNHPDNQQDPIRYRNLLREMESSLG